MRLAKAPAEITLVDRRNFHLFQPLTYQVATGALSPGDIAYPLRTIFKRRQNVHVVMAEVADFDLDARRLILRSTDDVPAPEYLPVRHAARGRRVALLLLRPRRLGRAGGRGEIARERARRAQPPAGGVRGRRARARRRAPRRMAHVRRRRRGPDRGRDGRDRSPSSPATPSTATTARSTRETLGSCSSRPQITCSRASRRHSRRRPRTRWNDSASRRFSATW